MRDAERVLCDEEESAGHASQTSSVSLDHTLMRHLCESRPSVRPSDAGSDCRGYEKQQQTSQKTLLAPNQGCCFTSNTELSCRCVGDQQMPIHWLCTVVEGSNMCRQLERLRRIRRAASVCLLTILYGLTAAVWQPCFTCSNNYLYLQRPAFKYIWSLSEKWCCQSCLFSAKSHENTNWSPWLNSNVLFIEVIIASWCIIWASECWVKHRAPEQTVLQWDAPFVTTGFTYGTARWPARWKTQIKNLCSRQ